MCDAGCVPLVAAVCVTQVVFVAVGRGTHKC